MAGGIGNFNRVVGFFLGIVGTVGASSSFCSSFSSISSVLILVLVSFLELTIARVVSYLAFVTGPPGPQKPGAPGPSRCPAPLHAPGQGSRFFSFPTPASDPTHSLDRPVTLGGEKGAPVQ